MDISTRLREARLAKGYSQEELANRSGVSQGTIANIENGHRKQPRGLLNIARALSIDPSFLLTGQPAGFGAPMATVLKAQEESPQYGWPFVRITSQQWFALPSDQREMIEVQIAATIEHHNSQAVKSA